MTAKEALEKYKKSQDDEKERIKNAPVSKFKRFWLKAWFLFKWPFKWLWAEFHDWRFFLIFVIVCAVVSCEVWIPYILGAIAYASGDSTTGKYLIGIASACWLFWLGPFTPFLPLCIAITCGIKTIFDKLRERRHRDRQP